MRAFIPELVDTSESTVASSRSRPDKFRARLDAVEKVAWTVVN